MIWKTGVRVEHENGMWLVLGAKKKQVADEDRLIVELMETGIAEDGDLVKKVSAADGNGDIEAGFRLAQFVEDYSEFIAESRKATVFGI